jgi:hypothetical protein
LRPQSEAIDSLFYRESCHSRLTFRLNDGIRTTTNFIERLDRIEDGLWDGTLVLNWHTPSLSLPKLADRLDNGAPAQISAQVARKESMSLMTALRASNGRKAAWRTAYGD